MFDAVTWLHIVVIYFDGVLLTGLTESEIKEAFSRVSLSHLDNFSSQGEWSGPKFGSVVLREVHVSQFA